MDKITGLMELLGEENNKKIKDKVTQFIIDAIEDDIRDYDRESYILNPEEIIDFVNECKDEAFKRVKENVVNQMVDKIKLSLQENIMKLGDIYKHKENNSIIQINSFASHMGDFLEGHIIVFRQIEKHNEFEIGSCPSFNGYGSQEEIENEYELLIPQEELSEYSDWSEILKLVDNC